MVAYCVTPPLTESLVLGFAAVSADAIDAGMLALAGAIAEARHLRNADL